MKRVKIRDLQKTYAPGTRIELYYMDDVHAPPVGTRGTIFHVDDIGTIHVNWDNGSSLGLIFGKDAFTVITEEENEMITDHILIEYLKRTLNIEESMSLKAIDESRYIVYLENEYFGIYDLQRNTFVD